MPKKPKDQPPFSPSEAAAVRKAMFSRLRPDLNWWEKSREDVPPAKNPLTENPFLRLEPEQPADATLPSAQIPADDAAGEKTAD